MDGGDEPRTVLAIDAPIEVAENPSLMAGPRDRDALLQIILDDIGPNCQRCKLAKLGRKQIVFGTGDPHAELMFIGEGPGADEDAQGLPFVGRAGQLLNNMIARHGPQARAGLHRQHREVPSAG